MYMTMACTALLLLHQKEVTRRKKDPFHLGINFTCVSRRSRLPRLTSPFTYSHPPAYPDQFVQERRKYEGKTARWEERKNQSLALGYTSRSNAFSRFLRRDRFRFLCWTRAREIVNLTKENPRTKWASEKKGRKKEATIRRGTRINGEHEETYTKWIIDQWRELRLRSTSSGCKFLIFRSGDFSGRSTTVREGGRRTKGRGCKGPLSARRPLCEATEW